MKKMFILILIIAFSSGLYAQSVERYVISPCAGSYFDGINRAIDYSTGELMITTLSNGSNILTQGFQQPFINSYISLPENSTDPLQFLFYPNPVVDQLLIMISHAKDQTFRVCIYDMIGQLLMEDNSKAGFDGIVRISFDMSSLSTGNYFVRVLQNNKFITTEKIIKINQ